MKVPSSLVAAVAVLMLSMVLSAADDADALSFTPPVQINTETFAGDSRILPGAGDDVSVLWSQGTVGNRDLFVRNSPDRGETWGEAINVSHDTADSYSPSVRRTGDRIFVAWWSADANTFLHSVLYTKSDNGGQTWSVVQNLSGATEGNEPTLVGTDPLFVVYDSGPGTIPGELLMRRSIDGGESFETPVTVTTNVYASTAIVAGDDLFVAYSATGVANAGATELSGIFRYIGGDPAQRSEAMFDINAVSERLDVGPEGLPYATWVGTPSGGALGVYHAEFEGTQWGDMVKVFEADPGASGLTTPDVAFAGDSAYYAWSQYTPGQQIVAFAARVLRNDVPVTRITAPGTDFFDPKFLVDGPNAYLAVTHSAFGAPPGSEVTQILGFTPGDLPASPDQFVPAGEVNGYAPDLAICGGAVMRAGGMVVFRDACGTFIEVVGFGGQIKIVFLGGPMQGDVDCAMSTEAIGAMTAADSLAILRDVASLPTPPCDHPKDVNCDGAVNVVDALAIQRAVAALVNAVRAGCSALGW